jgi:chaperonin GroES
LYDRLVIRQVEEKETYGDSPILRADIAKERPHEGIVIAAGNGRLLENGTVIPLDVKVGDHVLFGKYSGTDIEVNNEKVLILSETEVLVILEDA